MGLRLIYGKAGTGKSEFCLKEIKEKLEKNLAQKIYIIVPEQFSYATEKRLLEALSNGSTVNAEVITFKRMAYRVFSEIGGINKTNLSKTGKAMLISYILEKNKSKLNFLGKTNDIDLMLRTITELKKHNISTSILKEQIKKTNNDYLKLKLEDIYEIYEKYQETIANNYIDEDDILTILGTNIKKSEMFDNSVVYIDEFSGFTTQEYIIIEEILKKAKNVSIVICTDSLQINKNPENDIFYPSKQVVEKLINHCKNAKVKLEEPLELKNKFRFKNNELKFLEENIYNSKYKIYDEKVNYIHLQLCSNPYTEIENVANTIIKLVRDKNIRFKDISILTKNIQDYIEVILAVFSKFDIPIFIDNKKELSDNILVKYVLAIFEVLAKNWSSSAVWSYIKTGFVDIKREDIYILENYCKKWNIKGNKWYKEDWKYDSQNKDIEKLNELRKKVVTPLIKFKQKLENKKNATEITKALYQFLEENNIKAILEEKIENLKIEQEIRYANEYISSWNILMDILDEIKLVFENQNITFEDYRKILKSGLETSAVGAIPEAIDQVIVGDVERSRNHKVKTLFILSLNDGIFPNSNFTEGFLNDQDRQYLKEHGIEIAKGTVENIYEDRFNTYKAFATAENDIYLSYISSDKEGKAKRPSILINKVKKIFPQLKQKSNIIKEDINISVPKATFGELLANIRNLKNGKKVNQIWNDVYIWYMKNEEWKPKLTKAINGYNNKNKPDKISEENIKKLYGNTLKTSVSKLEQYKKCPFSFHLKYGLKLKEKEEFRIKPIDTGSFMHDIIDTFFANVKNVKNITEQEVEKKVIEIIDEKLNLDKNYLFTSTPKFIVLTNRLKKVIIQSIKYIVYQIQNSDFEILENEFEFKRKLDNIEITGKIDRIDELNTDNGKYIRIIDYKSSNKDIDLNELIVGTQLQLITYLDSMAVIKQSQPAGMLYFSLIDPIIKVNKNKTDDEIKDEIKKKFRMNGMILADINIIRKMDKKLDKGASSNIPVYVDKEGNISKAKSNILTKEQFTNIQKTAEKIIKEIAKQILDGNIDIKPVYYKKSKIDVCKYCEYKSICGFNTNNNNYTYIENKPKQEILENI
ncbi:MAG: helicase-exonuclease AddAB subunit AddB [Clostridia bacterium]|nr:helicase-exonuclease AddAB subunit AddB [Clostridia bacterium]